MLCDICKQNQAKVHLTQIVEGQTKKIDLCEACSKAKGIDDPAGFSLADLLMGLGAAQEMEQASVSGLMCPSCGFTQAEFKKTGRLGCADCYRTFSEGLEGLLKTMHKGTRHTGKIPHALQASRDAEEQILTLQKQLEKAIAGEDFEKAASLRDQLRAIRERQAPDTTTRKP